MHLHVHVLTWAGTCHTVRATHVSARMLRHQHCTVTFPNFLWKNWHPENGQRHLQQTLCKIKWPFWFALLLYARFPCSLSRTLGHIRYQLKDVPPQSNCSFFKCRSNILNTTFTNYEDGNHKSRNGTGINVATTSIRFSGMALPCTCTYLNHV